MTNKKSSKEKLRELIKEGKDIVSASGAHIISVECEMKQIKQKEKELRQKLSFLL